jgi:hypothetical protein
LIVGPALAVACDAGASLTCEEDELRVCAPTLQGAPMACHRFDCAPQGGCDAGRNGCREGEVTRTCQGGTFAECDARASYLHVWDCAATGERCTPDGCRQAADPTAAAERWRDRRRRSGGRGAPRRSRAT